MKYTTMLFTFLILALPLKSAEAGVGSKTPFQSCDFLQDVTVPEGVKCGILNVPEDHSVPQGKLIKVAYVIIPSKSDNPDFPVINFAGGPGGASLTQGAINGWYNSPTANDRDIILFDQRGIGHSTGLPNMGAELMQILADDATEEEEFSRIKALVKKYKAECESKGYNVQHFTTEQNANDVGFMMNALGYEKYNLLGASYGSLLARVVQDMFPQYLNSVILDSPALYTSDFLNTRLESLSLVLTRFFDFCENDPDCKGSYPNLRQDYLDVLKELKTSPLQLDYNNQSYTINVQDALFLIRRVLYSATAKKMMPDLIMALKNRDKAKLGPPLQFQFAYNNNFNFTMLLAIERHYGFNKKNSKRRIEKAYQKYPLLTTQLGLFDSFYRAGMDFHQNTLADKDKKFKYSEVPTLILVNYYDPVTPPENAYVLKKQLPNAQLLVLDQTGHVGGNFQCKAGFVNAYMSKPNGVEVSGCLNIKAN